MNRSESNLSRPRALALLLRCRGNEIWSVATCHSYGVPADWVDELADAYESGFESDLKTIYVGDSPTNQYHGVRDVDLAIRLGRQLGVDVDRVTDLAWSDRAIVQLISEAVIDGE